MHNPAPYLDFAYLCLNACEFDAWEITFSVLHLSSVQLSLSKRFVVICFCVNNKWKIAPQIRFNGISQKQHRLNIFENEHYDMTHLILDKSNSAYTLFEGRTPQRPNKVLRKSM